jgi:hypothetical protein
MEDQLEETTEAKFERMDAELYESVGRMIRAWSMVEGWLAHTLTILLIGNASGRQGETIYFEVPNIRPRIAIVRAAFFNRQDLDPKLHNDWLAIIDAIEREAPERNALVHGDFVHGHDDIDIAVAISPRIFSDIRRLIPPAGINKIGFYRDDVVRHTTRVQILADALWALFVTLPGSTDASPQKSVEEYLADWRVERGKREWPSIKSS